MSGDHQAGADLGRPDRTTATLECLLAIDATTLEAALSAAAALVAATLHADVDGVREPPKSRFKGFPDNIRTGRSRMAA